jgi:prepilin-type N-terminal cleavage/methylation domain-containing protein/prepilin-type processing-associated H-X9-DG protein
METQDLVLKRQRIRHAPDGFNVLEMLVVLAVLAILLGIGLPTFRLLQGRAKSVACASNLSALGSALNLYLLDHDNRMPTLLAGKASRNEPGDTLDSVLSPYVKSDHVFRCPADDAGLHESTGTSYFWNSLLNGQPATSLRFLFVSDPARIPVLSDKENFHRHFGAEVNLLYADGRVEKDVRFTVGPAQGANP